MFLEHFIASRLSKSTHKRSFSHVIMGIAMASVALSVAVMIIASAMINGFKKEISQKIFDFWGHIQITDAFTSHVLETSPIEHDPEMIDSLLDVGAIYYDWPIEILGVELSQSTTRRTNGGVKFAYPYIQYPAILNVKDDMEGLLLKGISYDFPDDFFSRYLVEGTFLDTAMAELDRDLIVSRMTADRLQLVLGDAVIIHFITDGKPVRRLFNISGIYKTGLSEYDKKVAFLDMRHLQQVLGWKDNQVSGIEVVLDDIDDLEVMDAYIYQEILPADEYTQTIRQRASSIFDWLDLQNTNEVLILALMLIVCIINMITALLILILERVHMIGVLKALGSNNWQIRKIFVEQAAHIMIKGLLIGNAIGLLLCFLQKEFEFIKLREEDYYLAVAPIDVNFWLILGINIGTLIISVLFLVLPSYFVSRISPTEAIRFS